MLTRFPVLHGKRGEPSLFAQSEKIDLTFVTPVRNNLGMTKTQPKFPHIKVSMNHKGLDSTRVVSAVLAAMDHNKVDIKDVNLYLDEILEAVTDKPMTTHAMRVVEVSLKWVTLTD